MFRRHLRIFLLLTILIAAAKYANGASYINRIDLAGDWQVQAKDSTWRDLRVPGSLESQIADLRSYSGVAVYRKEFPIPESWNGKRLLLKFGAVDWLADVSINGKHIGAHEGGYTPFQFDITDDVKLGEWNDLQISVTDVTPEQPFGSIVFDEIPHGLQGRHGPQSGIWQDVTLEAVEPVSVTRVRVTPDIENSVASVSVSLSKPSPSGELRLIVLGEGGAPRTTVVPLKADETDYEAEIKLDAPKLWSPDSPYVYRLQARVKIGDDQMEPEVVEFGMRKIEVKDNRVYLNNEPIFVTGVVDQDYYPLTECTAPSDEFLRAAFQRAKHMGINLIRCEAKLPDPRYLAWADRVGLIVWYEMPGMGKLTERSQSRSKSLLTEALERDYNHASLCMVSLVGSGSAIDWSNPEHRNWQRVMYESAKTLDPTRLIIDNSSSDGYHIKTDIEDREEVGLLSGGSKEFAGWISDLVGHPGSSFSPLGDSARRGWEPLLVSSAGSWGLPRISDIRKTYSGDPWWFESGSGSSKAGGVEQRFKAQGLDRVFGSMDTLSQACQWRQWEDLKSRIEEVRKHPQVGGYVLNQFSDVNWEADGLLDANRAPKVFYDEVRSVQGADVIIPDWRTVNYWSGAQFSLDVLLSHMSQRKLQDCRLTWRLEGFASKGEITAVSVESLSVSPAGEISFQLPSVEQPTRARLAMNLVSPTGETVADSYQDIYILPAATRGSGTPISLHDPHGDLKDLRARLSAAGYTLYDGMNRRSLVLTTTLDDAVRAFAIKGGRVILVAAGPESVPHLRNSDLALVPSDISGPWGDASRCVIWSRGSGPVRALLAGIVSGREVSDWQPRSVLTGMNPTATDDVIAGVFVGWLQNPAAVTAQFRAGAGKVLATTFDLLRSYGSDPAATTLLADMIAYASGNDFNPATRVDLTQVDAGTLSKGFGAKGWRFTTESPGETWAEVAFQDDTWRSPHVSVGLETKPGTLVRTAWEPSGLWMRMADEIDRAVTRARITYVSDEPFELYLNGTLVMKADIAASGPQRFDLDADALKLFRQGKNVLAVYSHQEPGGRNPEISLRYAVD